jgi:hypothetical protein
MEAKRMRGCKIVFWYLGVAVATGLLLASIAFQEFSTGVIALFLALVLTKINDRVPLPSFFASRLKQAEKGRNGDRN